MADENYADLLPSLSPLDDPDAAMLDRKGTMEKLLGPVTPEPQSWLDRARAADTSQQASVGGPAPTSNTLASAAPAATPAVPAGVTPTGDASGTPSWADLQRQNVTKGMASLDRGDASLQAMQNAPDLGSQTADLEAQRANDAAPISAYDQNGKVQSQYKPSFGQRLMRGVGAFARGGIIGAVDPEAVGATAYGAPNKQFTRDVDQQGQRVKSDDQQLANAAANWKAVNDRTAALAKETRAQADSRKGISTEITSQQGIPIRQQEADARTADAYNSSPEGKAEAAKELNAQTLTSRGTQADQLKLSGTNRVLFLANGKIPDPRQPTAEEIAQAQATKVFTQENGHPPQTLADYTKVRQAAKGESGGTTMMVPDGKGGFTATTVKPGDNVPAGTTTATGMSAAGKANDKQVQAAQQVIDDAETAHALAREAEAGNAPADVDLALAFFKAMKGSGSGIRFTQSEQNLIMGARNSAGDLQGVAQKVIGSGQKFTPDQRNKILRVIDIHADQAKKHMAGGSEPAATSGDHDIVVNPEDMK